VTSKLLLGLCMLTPWFGMVGCGARTSLSDVVNHTAVRDASSTSTAGGFEKSTTNTLFVESTDAVVLLPAPCTLRDAASGRPTQELAPTPTSRARTTNDVCGNARQEEYESCDDGDTQAGDGCNELCQIEPYHVCTTAGQRCVRLIVCGDGVHTDEEECDDGNLTSGDGCSPSCQLEVGSNGADSVCSRCPQTGANCELSCAEGYCGDGLVQVLQGETCDRGASNTSAYGDCTEQCTLAARCGDSLVQVCGDEKCDDGNRVGGDGCAADCKLEQLWVR
jgi:large repetitive protein